MHLALAIHPNSRRDPVDRIEVDVTRALPSTLVLRYVMTGKIASLRLPGTVTSARADGLWRHTCFEAFVKAPLMAGYHEFNFAPSTQWAAYRFSDYRKDMAVAHEVEAPRIEVHSDAGSCRLQATLKLDGVASLPIDSNWLLGVSAVVEDTSGCLSYWALAHPAGGAPDFHHPACFACDL